MQILTGEGPVVNADAKVRVPTPGFYLCLGGFIIRFYYHIYLSVDVVMTFNIKAIISALLQQFT
ncbi:hypothetical protein [Pseudodesulfovibrio aespoeensis]|uniref:hypothetical protein n=1 Tax=Pseudodesulfovibrio aespoeensis TaxID=182210 RepID=UPI002355E2F9